MTDATPDSVSTSERVVTLDAIRGLAVLGILVMNVVEFAHPFEAYENPAYAGGSTGADLWTWYAQITLFDGKMRALFSMLFGAGLVLFAQRMTANGQGERATDVLLRRCLWLVPFGIVHRFGLQWSGDILYQYGLLGALALAFRGLRARTLAILGVCTLLCFVPIGLWTYTKNVRTRDRAVEAEQKAAAGETVTPELAAAQRRYEARRNAIPPRPEAVQAEVTAMRQGYTGVFAHRWDYHHTFQSTYLYAYFSFDVFSMLLLGMALAKLGYFAGRGSTTLHVGIVVAGALTAGFVYLWARDLASRGFSAVAFESKLVRDLTYPFTRTVIALAWASALILVMRAGALRLATTALAAVGRMAFTNYVLQTVCCTLLFFGYGLGWYGSLSRAQLMLVVVAVSIVQITVSIAWLRHHRFGPLEWAWRSLTWWRRQPMRLRN